MYGALSGVTDIDADVRECFMEFPLHVGLAIRVSYVFLLWWDLWDLWDILVGLLTS